MNRRTRWMAALLLLPLAACGGDDFTADDPDAEVPALDPSLEPGEAVGAGVAPEDVGTGQTVVFEPVGDSGVGGEATVTDRGERTEVMVRLTGAEPGGSHDGHIHGGSCDAIGGVIQPLEPIEPDGTGTGTMTTTIDIPLTRLTDGQHVVVYHAAGGAPMTCAALAGSRE